MGTSDSVAIRYFYKISKCYLKLFCLSVVLNIEPRAESTF